MLNKYQINASSYEVDDTKMPTAALISMIDQLRNHMHSFRKRVNFNKINLLKKNLLYLLQMNKQKSVTSAKYLKAPKKVFVKIWMNFSEQKKSQSCFEFSFCAVFDTVSCSNL